MPQLGESSVDFQSRSPRVPPLQLTTRVAYLASIVAAIWYGMYVLDFRNAGQLVPYLCLVVAEVILLANAVGMAWTILASSPEEDLEVKALRRKFLHRGWKPSVDVLITGYGEDPEVVRRTVAAAIAIKGEHRTVVCDDGCSEEIEAVALELGADYVPRESSKGAKAGNLNHALSYCSGEFFATFDADHVPHPDFLIVTLPHFADPELAFVQSPQNYRETGDDWVARGAAEGQRVFYEIICPGKNSFNSMFYVGTNAIFNRAAIDSIGGINQDSNSEDIWTAINLHKRGWKSRFVPEIMAKGLSPDTLALHLKQQFRWGRGGYEVLFSRELWREGLTRDQRLQYLLVGAHYLQSIAIMFFLLLPPLFIMFDIRPIDVGGATWLLRYLPFFVFVQLALYLQVGGWRPSAMALSIASAPAQFRALLSVITGKNVGWKASNSDGEVPRVLDILPGAVFLLVVNLAGLATGLFTFDGYGDVVIALVLCCLHICVLGFAVLRASQDRRRSLDALTTQTSVAAETGELSASRT